MKGKKKIFLISLIVIILPLGIIITNKNILFKKEIKVNKIIKGDIFISNSIENLLDTFFYMEISSEKEDCKNLISDSKLAKIYNLKFNKFIDFNKNKENKKVTVNIKNIYENKKDSYIVSFRVKTEFNKSNEYTEKSVSQENYLAEVIKKDNNFYINKLVNHFDYIQTIDDNSLLQPITHNEELIPIDIFNKKTYDLILNNQLQMLESF